MADARGSDWVEGERVFGPPTGTWDADWVAGAAAEAGVPRDRADALAARAWTLLRSGTPAARLPDALGGPDGATVARAALEYCALYDVSPAAG